MSKEAGLKAVVIGNCQARPVAALMKQMCPEIGFSETIILHLANDATSALDAATFERVDFIFAQLTVDAFKPAHLVTSELRRRYGSRVIVWPNIFYAGQQPFLRYFTHSTGGRMLGPLEAMHDLRLYRSWLRTGTVNPESILDFNAEIVERTRTESLQTLRAREASCDVMISDVIARDHTYRPLFFTFNHPRRTLLAKMSERLLVAAGKNPQKIPNEGTEPLGRYRVPGLSLESDLQGNAITGDRVKTVKYSLAELCEAFRKLYEDDARYKHLEAFRFTPSTGDEDLIISRS